MSNIPTISCQAKPHADWISLKRLANRIIISISIIVLLGDYTFIAKFWESYKQRKNVPRLGWFVHLSLAETS